MRSGFREAFEDQSVLQRIDVGDAEHIRDERAGGRSAPWPDRNPALLGEVDEIPNDQDVADEAGLLEHAELVIEALRKLIVDLGAVAVTLDKPFAQRSRKYASRETPFGTGYSGYFDLPNSISRLQRSAIANVFAIASGKSLNSSRISSGDLK